MWHTIRWPMRSRGNWGIITIERGYDILERSHTKCCLQNEVIEHKIHYADVVHTNEIAQTKLGFIDKK